MSAEELSFEEYCRKKKIDPVLFLQSEPERFREWKAMFEQVHPDSFTEQKKFLINPIRKQYLLIVSPAADTQPKTTTEGNPKPAGIKILPIKKG